MKKFATNVRVYVSQHDIDDGKSCDPNKCMIKIAVARAINIPHGYIKVDATGISVTRRTDYREKAFLPKAAVRNMLLFDKPDTRNTVKPFSFIATFHKTSRVVRSSEERKARINLLRRRRAAAGIKPKKYTLHMRVRGLSAPKEGATA